MHRSLRLDSRKLFLLGAIILLLALSAATALADDDGTDVENEYVNPFLEDNMALYEEAMAMQGYITPGLAYLDDSSSDDQARHYSPLLEGIILGDSALTTRYDNGNELGLYARYDDENNSALGLHYRINRMTFSGYLDLADYALVEDTPASVRNSWTDNRNFGFELAGSKMLFNWDHRETNRKPEFCALNDYTSDRLTFTHNHPFDDGTLDIDVIYHRVDSADLGLNSRGSLTTKLNGRYDFCDNTRMRLGYSSVFAGEPGNNVGGSFARHILSGSLTRNNCLNSNLDVTAYGNYEMLNGEQTLNTHWNHRYDFGCNVAADNIDHMSLEAGLSAEYFDVEQIRYELAGLSELMAVPGLTEEDLEDYVVKNYAHTYNTYFKGKWSFPGGGYFSQRIDYSRHHDNKAPDGAPDTGADGVMPLTLYDTYEWKTGLNAPLNDNVFWQLSNVFRKWDMRLRESDGKQNTFTTSLTWNADANSAFSLYYQNLNYDFSIDELDDSATDQHGFGFDWWRQEDNDFSYTLGLFLGRGNGQTHDFDLTNFYGSIVFGPEGRWELAAEYRDSSNSDFRTLEFDVFNAALYYKIDI